MASTRKQRSIEVPLDSVLVEFYVRKQLDEERVLQFMLLYEAKEAMPPIEVVQLPIAEQESGAKPAYMLIDGRHRLHAQKELNRKTVEVVLLPPVDRADLIAQAFKANYGGSAPPTDADICHTLELLIGQGLGERQIMDRLPMPRGVTRRYMQTVQSTMAKRKIQQAAIDVVDRNMTIAAAAEKHGVDSVKLREHMSGKSKKAVLRGADQYKGAITLRFRSIANRNTAMLRKLVQQFEDGEVTENTVKTVLAHMFSLTRKQHHYIENWANRFEAAKRKLTGLAKA